MDSQLPELLCPKHHQTCQQLSYREMRKRLKNTKRAPSSLFIYLCEDTRILQLATQIPHYLFVMVQHFCDPNQYDLEPKKTPWYTAGSR